MSNRIRKIATAVAAASVLASSLAAADSGRQIKLRNTAKALNPSIGQVANSFQAIGNPDLIIQPRFGGNSGLPNTGYCGAWNGGNQKVYFYVKNIGGGTAPASDVQVNFGGSFYFELSVPPLSPNQKTLRSYAIPAGAWSNHAHPSVNFLIAADHNDDMVEESVTNNYGQSTCIGPAT